MEEIEESAISNLSAPPKIWKRCVDDSVCIIRKDDVSAFHDTLNSIDTNISFTIETECNGKLSFLDTLVFRRNGVIAVDVYRKPNHTDRYLDFNSHHDRQHEVSTASTLLHRALNLPNFSEGKKLWSPTVIHLSVSKTYRLKKPDPQQQIYIPRGTCWNVFQDGRTNQITQVFRFSPLQPLTRIFKKHDVIVVNKPFTTLQLQFLAPKFRPSMESQTKVVYKIPFKNCSWCYIGEADRKKKKDHLRNSKTAAKGSRIANHAWSNNRVIDFENASVIDKGTFRTGKTLEAWHTKVTPNADNNSCPLPGQYNILFNKHP